MAAEIITTPNLLPLTHDAGVLQSKQQKPVPPNSVSEVKQSKAASVDGKELQPPRDPKMEQVSREEFANAVNRLNEFVQTIERNLQFSVDEETGYTVITVIDSETEEIVRQIPPKEVLEMASNLMDTLVKVEGLLLKEQA